MKPDLRNSLAGLLAFLLMSIAPSADAAKLLTFSTSGLGGNWAVIGAGIAKLLTDKMGGVIVKPEITGGAVDNNRLIQDGETDIAMTVERITYLGTLGQGPFAKKKITKARMLLSGFEIGNHQLVTMASSGIRSIPGLKGRRVSAGPSGGGATPAFAASLAAHGMTFKDMKTVFLNYDQTVTALVDGNLDAGLIYSALNIPVLKELQASGKKFNLISIDEDKIKQISKSAPGYIRIVIPKEVYGLDKDTVTIGARNGLIVASKLANETVYQIIKIIDQNLEEVRKIHPSLKFMKRGEIATASVPIPYHPGAVRYYKEAGLLK